MTRGNLLVVGSFGTGDLGEDAAAEAAICAMSDWTCVLLAHDPSALRTRRRVRVIPSADRGRIHRALGAVDGVCFTGDRVFGSARRGSLLGRIHRAALLGAAARVRGDKVGIIGTRANRLQRRSERLAARALVRSTDVLVLHGADSADILATAGCPVPMRVGTDPTWALTHDVRPSGDRSDDVVVVLDERAAGRDFDTRIVAALEGIPDGRIILEPWGQGTGRFDDRPLASAIADGLGGRATVIEPPAHFEQCIERYGRARAVISMRSRALVAAAAARVPTLTLLEESRMAVLPNSLGQPVVSIDAAPAELGKGIRTMLAIEPPDDATVAHHVAMADESFRLFRLVLTDGEEATPELARLDLRPVPWRT